MLWYDSVRIIPKSSYGLELAEFVNLPSNVIDKAKEVIQQLSLIEERGRMNSEYRKLAERRKAVIKVRL